MVAKIAPLITTAYSHSLNWEGKNSGINISWVLGHCNCVWATSGRCTSPDYCRKSSWGKRYLWGMAEASSSSVLLGTLQSVPGLSSDVQELLVSLLCTVSWWNAIWPRANISIYWETAPRDSWCFCKPVIENITPPQPSLGGAAEQCVVLGHGGECSPQFGATVCPVASSLCFPFDQIPHCSLPTLYTFQDWILCPWHLLHMNPLFSFLYQSHRVHAVQMKIPPTPSSSD